ARYPLPRPLIGRILTSLFDACTWSDLGRLPELFCGFARRPGEGPTQYPVACSPQSWSAGAVLMLLQATLGLSIDAVRREIRFNRPLLPPCAGTLTLRNLRVGDASVDLDLHAHHRGVEVGL